MRARHDGSSASAYMPGAPTSADAKARPANPAHDSSAAVAVGKAVFCPPAFAVMLAISASVYDESARVSRRAHGHHFMR